MQSTTPRVASVLTLCVLAGLPAFAQYPQRHGGLWIGLGFGYGSADAETFGDEIANDLVEWFNAVDATYRADLRELNELNFARFDAKLEQRLAELDAKWSQRWTELDAEWSQRWTQLDAKLDRRLAELKTDLVRWMFAFWAPTALATVALLLKR